MLSDEAAAMTVQHRADLAAMSEQATRLVEPVLRSFDPADITTWWERVRSTLVANTARFYRRTAAAQALFMPEHAAVEGVALTVVESVPSIERMVAAYRLQLVARSKLQAAQGFTGDAIKRQAIKRARGTTRRLALAGGRETMLATFDSRPVIVGYRRVTAAGPCSFCAMLAGRGAVYRSQQTASAVSGGRLRGPRQAGQAFHDHCRCTVEPLYDFDL